MGPQWEEERPGDRNSKKGGGTRERNCVKKSRVEEGKGTDAAAGGATTTTSRSQHARREELVLGQGFLSLGPQAVPLWLLPASSRATDPLSGALCAPPPPPLPRFIVVVVIVDVDGVGVPRPHPPLPI